ncbi:MAG: hypothetical protein HKN89_06535 [Eudoraea sp.]|nr:hypothetical protein [Eudoraea sp.]
MKKFLQQSIYAVLLALALTFTGCQEEFEPLPDPDQEQQTLMANSATGQLIAGIASNDGSFDNIVDGASCFDIKFPYTVAVNGITLTIENEEGLHIVEEIFDQFDNDADYLDIIFPITITIADYSEIVIENLDQLRDLAEECIEGGDDDDIECIDFVYPITLYTFDLNEQQTGSVTVENDYQLRRFFAGLDDDDFVSIDFPITLVKSDGTEVLVGSNEELVQAIEMAKEMCDEDDDDDYNDDDFTEERLRALLVECPWFVKEIERDAVSLTDQYFEYLFNFTEDGAVVVKDREGNMLTGVWDTRVTDYHVKLIMEFDILVDFTLEWYVYEISPGKIKLYASDKDLIVMESACDIINDDPNTLREILKECAWVIKKVKNQGEEIDRLLGWEFQFHAEGVVTLSNGESTSEGSWEITMNAQGRLVMALSFGSEPAITFEWPLSDLRNDRLKFAIEEIDYELVLQRVCDDTNTDGDLVEIRSIMAEGNWIVAQYKDDGVDETELFTGTVFNFLPDHIISVTESPTGPAYAAGFWRVIRNSDGKIKVYLNFGDADPYGELTDDWKLVEISPNRIVLRDVSDDYSPAGTVDGTDLLVFERN